MLTVKLTSSQARKIILHAAGLARRAQFGKGKEAVYKAIDQLGFVQVDTIYVVERAHHHALASRVPDYEPAWLTELQAEGRIFEFWTYASGFIPMNHFRFSLPVKESFLARRNVQTQAEVNLMKKILDRIGREGPLMARDFENDRVTKSSGWWDWRPSKVALERLHLEGKLVTLRRPDFQKVYDLAENVIPAGMDTSVPSSAEFARHVIRQALRALGIAYAKEIAFSSRYTRNSNTIKAELQKMVQEGEVIPVSVEGLKGSPLYMLPAYKKKKITVSGDAFVLSPFDILNVYRHRLRDFFKFDYQVECFVPAPKRKYGYFSLPVLVGDTFVARMDCKADRKTKRFTVNNIHFETVKLSPAALEKISTAIKNFVRFNGCAEVTLAKSNHKTYLAALRKRVG